MTEENRIKIERVRSVLDALNIIPRAQLPQTTRVKILRWLMAYDELRKAFDGKVESAREKAKPEGFDERMSPYRAALLPTQENRAEAEKQTAAAGFAEAKAEWDRVNADFREVCAALETETTWDAPCGLPAFTDGDFEAIGAAIPSGGPSIMQSPQTTEQGEPTPDGGASPKGATASATVMTLTNDQVLMILMNTLK